MDDKNEPGYPAEREVPRWFLAICLLLSAALFGGLVYAIFSQPKYTPPALQKGEDPLDALQSESRAIAESHRVLVEPGRK